MSINTISLYSSENTLLEYKQGEAIVKIKTPNHEEGFGLIIKNDSSSDVPVKIKGGNSIMSVGDTIINAKPGDTLINLKNTGRYKNVSGENAGFVVIELTQPDDISLAAFSL